MNRLFVFLAFLFLFGLALTPSSKAQSTLRAKIQGFLVTADQMERDSDQQIISLKGHVQLTYEDQHIKADHVEIRLRTRQVECNGNVEVITPENTVFGKYALLDYEAGTGIIADGYVQAGPLVFRGQILERKSRDQFLAKNAAYTSCATCPAAWSFSGSLLRADLGSYAYIKNPVLRVGGIPILPLPYIIVPLKSDRQSGLLTPEIEHSPKGGLTLSQPFFWAISRNQDLTFTLKSSEFRGIKSLFGYRYVLSENSSGHLDFGTLNDRVFVNEERWKKFLSSNQDPSSFDRWFVRYNHIYEMPQGITQRTSLNFASDLQYGKDFPAEALNHGDPSMENRFSLVQNKSDTHIGVDTSYHINYLRSDPRSSSEDAIHRFPEIRFAKPYQEFLPGFWYNLDMNFTRFARFGRPYDDLKTASYLGTSYRYVQNSCDSPLFEKTLECNPTYDGSFDPENDILRSGQRLRWQSSIYRPLHVKNWLEIVPKLTYSESHYHFDYDPYGLNTRRFLRTEVAFRSILTGVHQFESFLSASKFRHDMIPEITVANIPWIDHPSHPFFANGRLNEVGFSNRDSIDDSTVANGLGPQFDYWDRLYDRNIWTFGITNKLTEKRIRSGNADYQQIALFKLFQSYDAYQATQPNSKTSPWSDISGVLDIRMGSVQSYTTFSHYPTHQLTNLSSRIRLSNDRGHFFQYGIARNYVITPGVSPDPQNKTEDHTVTTGFTTPYLNLLARVVTDGNWLRSANKQIIRSWAYITQFKLPGECWLLTLVHRQVTDGDPLLTATFDFSFDGKPKPAPAPENLDLY